MPFGADTEVVFARKLWAAIEAADLVAAAKSKGTAADPASAVEGEVWVAKRVGRVIIKVDHGHSDSGTEAVRAQADASPSAYAVMFKKPAGYDTDNKNWFWARYDARGRIDRDPGGLAMAGRIAKGRGDGCIACHRTKLGSDLEIRD